MNLVKALGACATLAPSRVFRVKYSTGGEAIELTIYAESIADAKAGIESITGATVIHVAPK
jgi:hypothetical protein